MDRQMITGKDILKRLWEGEVQLPPLTLTPISRADLGPARFIKSATPARQAMSKEDWETGVVFLRAAWRGREYMFAVTCQNRATPKTFREALLDLQQRRPSPVEESQQTGCLPLLVVPYLSGDQLDELERVGVSGIDLCGNGVVVVPGELLVCRTGNPNRYRESFPIRNVYRGNSSVVARVFLARPEYREVGDILREVRLRGAKVALSTVSKVLKRLEEDLVVSREALRIRLLQPDVLLENLAGDYRSPRVARRFVGKSELPTDELMRRLTGLAQTADTRLVVTGLSSVGRYAVMAREGSISLYCTNLRSLLQNAGSAVSEGERFANLEILETDDEFVYLDTRKEQCYPWASPAQAYLELMQGDKRDQETADQVRQVILKEVKAAQGITSHV